ncbi:unnamed protein product [Didymodactylos carnosus]|uniref:Flavoprotein pyridine nucleotide cytochrome reductase-like FAD-binding domain-containing protein n=1 Tax=Didymodactylos carnosus TaxID=1234261 RepID=A0A815FA22_9BILA|nr:unnamed protein product [Didymodactylos carnosus]CAF1323627.1 unnamed protein product [Didymodactylos carnosus]CAF3975571.1 unnamed protein product [Didymodactylos carnosus]CAF4171591.1 unnamed protein product [Didymodactylos carnosus]
MTTDGLDKNSFRSITRGQSQSRLFTFAFDDPQSILNLKISSCTALKANIDGKDVYWPYTVTTRPDTQVCLEFPIKYFPQGVMSKSIHNMKMGIKFRSTDQASSISYCNLINISFIPLLVPKYDYQSYEFKNLTLIVGGTASNVDVTNDQRSFV